MFTILKMLFFPLLSSSLGENFDHNGRAAGGVALFFEALSWKLCRLPMDSLTNSNLLLPDSGGGRQLLGKSLLLYLPSPFFVHLIWVV